MDAHELARWTRFAARGGIGKCTAIIDCIAQEMGEDLMFLKDDQITVLMQLPDSGFYLGHCEGVVGRFSGTDVRFHGKLKKPVMAKRGSVGHGPPPESRVSISLVQGNHSRTDLSRRPSESPSRSRPASRAKGTPSPSHTRTHAPMQSYSTSYTRFSEDQSPVESRSTTVVGTHPTVKDSRPPSVKSGHAKPAHMATSVSGASVFSVGSASIYSEASTATSVFSAVDDRTRSRDGSLSSGETEKDDPDGNLDQANGAAVSMSDPMPSNANLPTLASASSMSASTSLSSFASTTSTYGPDTVHDSFGSVGSISELEAKQFDMSTFGMRTETQTGFVLVPPPLKIGDEKNNLASPVVAPLRLTKSPRLTPSPGLPPSSPLPMPPAMSGDYSQPTSASPTLPSPLSRPRPSVSTSLGFPGPLSPGLPPSLAPGPRPPGLPGSLSPGFRSPAFSHGSNALTFTSSSGPNTPPLASPYGSEPSPTLPSPFLGAPSRTNASTPPVARTPPTSSPYGLGHPNSAPLSPPPSSPLPPVPSTPGTLSTPSTPTGMGSAASAAASGRASPLSVLSSSLPSVSGTLQAEGGTDGDGRAGMWDVEDEGEAGRLSTLDAFRRRWDDSDEGEAVFELDRTGTNGERDEDAQSDGEVGIGLSLMGALGEDEEEEEEERGKKTGEMEEVKTNGNMPNGTSAMPWTRYTPSSPISPKSPGGPRPGEEEGQGGDEEEDEEEDDGGYWDDIYDDYRYSRYSLASKRFSVASKASGASKASSSKARANAPPMPIPPDRPSVDTSIGSGSDTNGRPRPSFESGSSSGVSMPFARPSLTRTASEESGQELTLTAQFPAVPVHVPVRTESRLRIVHDGYMEGDEHGEREQRVTHGSTEDEIELNIEVIAAADDGVTQEVAMGPPNGQALSPLLHTTFGSPLSSRGTDWEESDGRRSSHRSGVSSAEGSKSPIDGGAASALRAQMEAERGAPDATSKGPAVRVTVADDEEDGPNPATEIPSPSTQTPNAPLRTVVMDPVAETDDADEPLSPFLRARPQPSLSPHPHPFARTSLFLPHPNAPKAVCQSQGPMYGRTAPTQAHAAEAKPPATPPGTTAYSTQILHQLRNVACAPSVHPGRRGAPRTVFGRCRGELGASMGPVPILFSLDPFPAVPTPARQGADAKTTTVPMRAATVSAHARREEMGGEKADGDGLRLPKRAGTTVGGAPTTLPIPIPIPREGFIPKVGAARPRSRSFSEFGASGPVAVSETRREGPAIKPSRDRSLPPALTARQALSPLVLQGRNDMTPPSPFVQEPLTRSPRSLDAGFGSPVMSPPMFTNSPDREEASPSTPASLSDPRHGTSLMPARQGSSDVAPWNNSTDGLPQLSADDDSPMATPPLIPEASLPSTRSSPLAHEVPLRTKLSLPALRVKASVRSKLDDAVSVVSLPVSGENETVQVQDMDFELVKPSLAPASLGRTSQDSMSRDVDVGKPEASPVLGDTASLYSTAPRSPLAPSHAPPSTESAESIDAHRQRELKWMAFFPTVPPSQARKNKKVRKMLQEGVPSSVRYLVWCHLTDSKARALPGVYAKLGKRARIPAFAEIKRDAREGFPDQPQFHSARGPLTSLLQAYLSMVPDIVYSNGLTLIAGHLLLLAPEEDAFWIFASMMDAHLRAYFATNTVQVEIDASLFSKALEASDPALTKKLYVQLAIAPANITRPWFSTLFVGSLSADLLHRVWDIFLYDGIPFLYRIGLVVVNCVRHLLLQATTEEAALAHLARPPPACLPSAAELLVLASNVKLKDDDVRKQRVKMGQQLKRTTQARPPNGVTNVQTATISLPKTSMS